MNTQIYQNIFSRLFLCDEATPFDFFVKGLRLKSSLLNKLITSIRSHIEITKGEIKMIQMLYMFPTELIIFIIITECDYVMAKNVFSEIGLRTKW